MSFVMIATGATSRSRVRTVPMAPLLAVVALSGLMLLGAGGALGYWLAVPSFLPQAAAQPAATTPQRPHAALPFALEQLGALSGRLFRLESQAAQLSKRIGILQKDDPSARDKKNASAEKTPAAGGPLLPPRALPDHLGELDSQLARLEEQIAAVSDAATEKNLDLMRLPTRLPVRGAELTSTFGYRQDPIANRHAFHAGLDFAAQHGTPLSAAAGGKVVFAGFRSDFGWMVEI